MQQHVDALTPGRRILEMVSALHAIGYERLRIQVGLAPSGLYWRCGIYPAPAEAIDDNARDSVRNVPWYSTGQERAPYDWIDAANDTPSELAAKFIERFPDVVCLGLGSDPDYVHWFREMMALTIPNGLPYASADYDLPEGYWPVVWEGGTGKRDVRVDLPP